ncbi:universal stress protein [Actinacidiphila bryophytorum]|uniref:universal stress protein n=1 Tax=Actinacidiphila bryophytorum TaxID=1436133 RepID=UPI002176E645|nr:universal stress protein [Actinacidiphila bryophytorum]UWE10126.1 universal stress protein [Actinacidiphila bryophytorum]
MDEQKSPTVFERGTDGPKVIVAGIDGSDSSWRAAAYAAGMARRQNALLALVYVQPYLPGGAALGVPVSEVDTGIAAQLVAEIRASVERLRGTFQVRWEFHTFRGDPFGGLAAAADQLTADAVVVGASEQAGHRLVGSVAVRLVKAGKWPVTVVP